MGLSSSKHNAAGPSSTSSSPSCGGFVRRNRSARTVLNSSRLLSRGSENEEPQISECSSRENGKAVSCSCKNKLSSCQYSSEDDRRDRAKNSNAINSTNSCVELQEWGEPSFSNPVSREGNTSRDLSSHVSNPTSRLLSRFSIYPGNLSFRLSGANSLGSSASCTRFSAPNEEDKFAGTSNGGENRIDGPRGWDFLPSCFTHGPPRTQDNDCASDCSSSFLDQFPVNRRSNSVRDALQSRTRTRVESVPDSTLNLADVAGVRHGERRIPAREPVDRNVRFSRTLSVGRLRDRVLRRTIPSDFEVYDFQQDRGVRLTGHASRIRGPDRLEEDATRSDDNDFSHHVSSDNGPSGSSHSLYGVQNNGRETVQARETRYSDLLEHRSHFLERRRRIRSHVRALQRLGSRFQNLSGHERSCILSGQHRGGPCNCSTATRDGNVNDNTNATASISRIVMLAEALFEVLDEIHQQSVVLSSRPSVSSIGSIPAPNGVVDSLPVKIFSKLKKKSSEDTAQCYICLVEYEEGDSMRILPCHHEFHRTCIDKWLKEIHRVCPLCRGDVCQPDSLAARD